MRPLLTIASAADLTLSSVTALAKQFQLFQPIAGGRPICEPQTIFNFRSAWPSSFLAWSVTTYSPSLSSLPVIRPDCASNCKPDGRPSAENVIGRSPVDVTVKRNGEPGRTPNKRAPVIRGVGAGFGVRTTASSMGGTIRRGLPEVIVTFKFPQSAWSPSIPSPPSATSSTKDLTPFTSSENSLAASFGFIKPLFQISLPSACTLKTTVPRPLSSSTPALPDNTNALPSTSREMMELACMPTPLG